ncbi:helix-turn-helix domain-containing protein [Aegicerativicinus sediminis]|uniref:helix-turn-helix domain-containing protein n=1 Tax=Aegicerativicinus sediminis TaxID=2893202 RepID=UPI001E311740|nr:AraC family transcriptional regulator [Aegicerativicinus sediminis]
MVKINNNVESSSELLPSINKVLNGNLSTENGETILSFNNHLGKGKIRNMDFSHGVSLLSFNLKFNSDVQFIFNNKKFNPIEFIFITKGELYFQDSNEEETSKLLQYQNIIISNKKSSQSSYIFPKDKKIKVNFIMILRDQYNLKSNHNVDTLEKSIKYIFDKDGDKEDYSHLGSFNLKIADLTKQLNKTRDSGIIRSLTIEGYIALIMAMQLMEHHNHINDVILPESLSQSDIKKIHKLSGFIVDHISEDLTVKTLAMEIGLSPKKLQLGFKLLYSKSVNEYVRQHKLEIARDLIKNTDYSISEVVYKIGYRSRSYFSKIFQEYYGILPIDYREKVKSSTFVKS